MQWLHRGAHIHSQGLPKRRMRVTSDPTIARIAIKEGRSTSLHLETILHEAMIFAITAILGHKTEKRIGLFFPS